MDETDFSLVMSNLPNDTILVERVVKEIIISKLAACVNVLAPCQSYYLWNEVLETSHEIPILIKTQRVHLPALTDLIQRLHPYQVPEIIALPIQFGFAPYLEWIKASTHKQ